MRCFFASDLHGRRRRYERLFAAIEDERPDVVLLGGDLLPHAQTMAAQYPGVCCFPDEYLAPRLRAMKVLLGEEYPDILLIMGNDDPRREETAFDAPRNADLWTYLHFRCVTIEGMLFFGYNYVPPTPFQLKDWERYDVSHYVEPGCVSPEEGRRTVKVDPSEIRYATIAEDLATLTAGEDLSSAIMLFHAPPYRSALDRAALDGKMVDHAPLDVHVGSIAIEAFIRARQPAVTLHGHIHESVSITGKWSERIGESWCFGAAHDGPELALVDFDPLRPGNAVRRLL